MLLISRSGKALAAWLLVGGVAACASQPSQSPLSSWPSGTWVLQHSDVAGLESVSGGVLEISFETHDDAHRVTGYGGCNRFSGSARFADGTLGLGPLVSTKRACVGDGQAREHAYFGALIQVSKVLGDGAEQLSLQLEDGRQMQFLRRRAEVE